MVLKIAAWLSKHLAVRFGLIRHLIARH